MLEAAKSADTRYSCLFFDQSQQTRFAVDEENYCIESQYDAANRLIGTVHYADRLTDAELTGLKTSQPLARVLDPTRDRWQSSYFDGDNLVIGAIDPAGWVTETLRDIGGRAVKITLYHTPVRSANRSANFNDVRPPASVKDAHRYQFYNAKNKVIGAIDPNGFLTNTEYYANDLIKATITYYQPVARAWLDNPSGTPPLPTPHPEDARADFTYNALGQFVTSEHSNQCKIHREYDSLGQLINQSQFDKTIDLTKNTQPDVIRAKRTQRDGWQQIVKQTNPFIAQKMLIIEWDPHLTPEQKKTAISALWLNESTRHTFEPVTGLLCSVTNSLNARIVFYYDQERRLILSFDALGKATEHTYTPFGDLATTRQYFNHIPLLTLNTLTGGFMSDTLRALLICHEDDLLDQFIYDQCGTLIKHTDPAGYISEFIPNAFKEMAVEKLPVNNAEPSLTITHTFNPRGQAIRTVQQASELERITTVEFANPHSQVTKQMDAEGGIKTFDYDFCGNPIMAMNNGDVIFQGRTFDAQGRLLTSHDAVNAQTQHRYTQATRTQQLITPVVGTSITTQTNVFNEFIKTSDAQTVAQTISHAPDGQVTIKRDELGRMVQAKHNSEGWLIEQISASGVETLLSYNAVGINNKIVVDNRTTLIDLDTFYRNATVTNPRGVVTQNHFDKRGLVLSRQVDTTGAQPLNLLVTKKYNGQRVLFEEVHGDVTNPHQYHVTYQQDAFGRPNSKIIDPAALALTTISTLDKLDRVIKHTDQNGAIYRLYYDLSGNKRFKIAANGAVQTWRYDAMNRVNYHAVYENPVLVDDHTSTTQLEQLVSEIVNATADNVSYHFRDANGSLRFSVRLSCQVKAGSSSATLQGIVKEQQYNDQRHEKMQCVYATLIDVTSIATFSTASLERLSASIKDAVHDRSVYKYYNPAGDCCFSINARGKLHETRFDAEKRVVRAIDYATPMHQIDAWLALTFDDFCLKVLTIADPSRDHVQAYGFDTFGKPLYSVNATGQVIRFLHDENNNLIEEIHFSALLAPVPIDDAALKVAVMALVPDPNCDRIKKFTFNNADAQIKIIDPLGNEDIFERDALSHIKQHHNREGQITSFAYDRAKRQVLTTTPAQRITTVSLTPDGKLSPTAVMRAVKTKRDYDNNNNVISLLADFEGDQQRSVTNTYTPLNRLQTVTVPTVSIDDPSKPASLNPAAWPVVSQDVKKTALYNAKGLLIVAVDENEHYRFNVYDNLNRLRFLSIEESRVDNTILCSVTGYDYNAFGDKVWETHYATFISVAIQQAKTQGLALVQVANQLQNNPQDQVKWYDYNQTSDWTMRISGIIRNPDDSRQPSSFYFNPATQDIGTHYRLMQRTLTIFGQPELISTLISPNPETWQHQRISYDQGNKPILEAVNQRPQINSTTGFRVKLTTRNAHQEIITTQDFYTPCSLNLTDLSVPYDAVKQFYLKVENTKPGFDKIKTYTYTLQGKKASRTLQNVAWASLELIDPQNPRVKNNLTDAVERFDYSAIEKLIRQQLANGAFEYHFHNAAGDLIAHAAQPRQLSSVAETTLIPLKIIGLNAHGQAIIDSVYVNGATLKDGIPIATPAAVAPEDQATLKLMDSARGLTIATQNARGLVTSSTFSATKQQARTWGALTSRINPKTLIYERNFLRDARGRVIGQLLKEDHQLIQATYKQFSPFGDEMLAGPDNATWPLYRVQDNSGRTWKSNENKVPTVLLHDLRANVTAEIIAQQTDVKSLTYEQLIPLIHNAASHYDDIEITLSLRDENSRLLRTVLPRATPSLKSVIANIPLQVSSSAEPATLSWLIPSASNVDMTFSCWVDPVQIYPLPIQAINGRCHVDVSSLATDIYTYRIDYSLKAPTGAPPIPQAPILYQTTGSVGIISANQNNQRVVARVVEDHKLTLAGVNDLVEVTLFQDSRTIGTFPLEPDQSQYWIDLASLVSGTYSAHAITRSGVTLNVSLPFILNTALAPSVPLAREIPALSQLMTLNQYGQLSVWNSLPKDYQHSSVSLRIRYLDQNDTLQEEHFVIDPATPTTTVTDPAGHKLQANIHFEAAIKEIKDYDIQLLIGADAITLYQRVVPSGSQDLEVTHILHGRRGNVEKTTVPTHRGQLPDAWVNAQSDSDESWHALEIAKQTGHRLLAKQDELTALGADLDPTLIITWSCPPVRIAWLRGLSQTYLTPPTLHYLDVSADHLATWKDKVALSVTTGAIVLDVTGFSAGNYPYIFAGGTKTAPLILSLTLGSNLYSSMDQPLLPPDPLLRHIDYTRDVRGNAVSEMQASGALYDRSFSLRDHVLTETGPVISIQAADGTVNDHFRPVTQRVYDIRGLFFGTLMPAGNLEAYVLNAAGDRLAHLLGDGTIEARFSLDGFGRCLSQTLANNAVFNRAYNQGNQLIRYAIPNDDVTRNNGHALIHTYTFNELDQQDQHLDAAGNAWQIDFDSRNNPHLIKIPTGVITTFTYGRDKFLLSCQNPLLTLTWLPDHELGYFGVIGQHTDGGGSVITYEYNKKGDVIAKRGVGGNHGNMTQLRESTVSKMIRPAHKHHPAEYVLCDVFTPITVSTPPVNSEYRYIAGRLMAIKDLAQQVNTQYSYDAGNRPTSVGLSSFDQTIIHTSSAIYNALGDEIQIYNDSLLNAVITYDANRNVRRKLFDVNDHGRELTSKLDHGFSYDRADRAVIVDGAFTTEGVQLLPGQGFETTYIHHQRTAESQLLPNGTRQSFDYSYWQSGELHTAQLRDSTLLTRYFYHPSGYQRLRDGSHQLYWRNYLKNTTAITTDTALFQTNEVDETAVGRYYEHVITNLSPAADGRSVENQSTQDNNSQSNFSYGYQYHYLNFDSPQATGINGWSQTRDGRRNVSSSITHDAHGTVNGKWGVSDDQPSGHSTPPWLIWYVNGDDGTTYQKWYLYAQAHFSRSQPIPLFGIKNVYFYSPRGAYLGSYQNQLPSTLGAGTVSANLQYHLPTSSGKIAHLFNNKTDRVGQSQPGGSLSIAENIGQMMSLTTRSAAYRHKNHHEDIKENWHFNDFVSSDSLSPVPQVVTVKTGDTYDLLAQSIYGTMADASASLAESAGDAAGVIPQVGAQVITPQFIPQGNKSTDQLPPSRVQQYITGTLLPHLQFAEPHSKKGHCTDTIVRVAIDIIAVAIAYFSGGTASELSVALIEIAIAAASDAALQEIAVNVGLLQSFSWQEVITTGITAGMVAGFSAPAGAGATGSGVAANFFPTFFSQFTFARLIQLMVFAGTMNIMDQLALIAAGKRSGFDAKELLAAIVEAGIAQGISSSLTITNAPQLTRALNEVTDDMVATLVGSAIMGGSPDIEIAMAQAIGATIGNSIGDQVRAAHDRASEVNSSQATHIGAARVFNNMGPMADSAYYHASAASQGIGANASASPLSDMNDLLFGGLDAQDFALSVLSNSNIPVTSVKQQAVRPIARTAAIFASPSQSYQDPNPIFPYLLGPVTGITMAQSSVNNAWGMANGSAGNSRQQPGFFNGLYKAEKQSYMSITKWSAATVESISETAKTMSEEYYLMATKSATNAKNILNAPVMDSLASEAGVDVNRLMAKTQTNLANTAKLYGNLLSKLSLYAKVGILSIDAIQKGIAVAQVPQGQRTRVGFVKGAEFVGEVAGVFVGEVAVGATVPASLGTSLIVLPAVIVGTSTAGEYFMEHLAEWVEDKHDFKI